MLYFNRIMKRLSHSAIILGVSLLIALSCAAASYTTKISSLGYSTSGTLLLQTNPAPKVAEDQSEVGSTDTIVIMGGVITLIVLIPILTQRKAWMRME